MQAAFALVLAASLAGLVFLIYEPANRLYFETPPPRAGTQMAWPPDLGPLTHDTPAPETGLARVTALNPLPGQPELAKDRDLRIASLPARSVPALSTTVALGLKKSPDREETAREPSAPEASFEPVAEPAEEITAAISDDTLRQAYRAMDADRDGSVSQEEWRAWQGGYAGFDALDTDADGVLSFEEYRHSVLSSYG